FINPVARRWSCPHRAVRLWFRDLEFTAGPVMNVCPRLLITMGDVAGIGPEVISRAWPELTSLARPVVVGDPRWMEWAVALVGSRAKVAAVAAPGEIEPDAEVIPCLPGSKQTLSGVEVGHVSAAAGKAAYDFLCTAIDLTLAGTADGIVTAPLHKEGL